VLHILEAVHHEGDTEARPEPGEAEGGAEEPGHEAWFAGGRGRDSELTVRTLDGGRVGTKLGNWNLNNFYNSFGSMMSRYRAGCNKSLRRRFVLDGFFI